MHQPVLISEVSALLNIKENGRYIDATLGEGGYTDAILSKGGYVLGIDLDESQYQRANIKYQKYISNINNLKLVHGNFKDIEEIAKKHHFYPADGVVFDLGLSMRQIGSSGKGFSFKNKNEPLDMRLDEKLPITASLLLNTRSADELYRIFSRNSEEINSQKVAEAVVVARVRRKLLTVGDLTRVIDKVMGRVDETVYRRIFQALRIEVNDEFNNLKKGLSGALKVVNDEGRVVVVTFHSLEDRIVKKFIKNNSLKEYKIEIKKNKRKKFERSAMVRVFSK